MERAIVCSNRNITYEIQRDAQELHLQREEQETMMIRPKVNFVAQDTMEVRKCLIYLADLEQDLIVV